ncbi:T9SS type A sorting domain-containing protein [Hwangdonia sp.]|uniref:T9SS type A sorting domain-containing protein n=1 Tax=Hwangdonia sp. TaxID=1883432 RepID=UPI003AB7A07A
MKKLYFLFLLFCSFGFAQVTLPHNDGFAYADGSLIGNGGWLNHSGTSGDLVVSAGKAIVQHGAPSEDAKIDFTAVSGCVYFGLDFSVDDLGAPYSGADNEYFAHFMVGTGSFRGRLDIVPPSASGDYSVGIATSSGTADAVWATDLTFGVTYRAIVKYDQDSNQAQLWINATSEGDTSILGADETDPGDAINAFGLRQSDSSENETVRVDNLYLGATFGAVLSAKNNQIEGFSMYPNPTNKGYVNMSSRSNSIMEVSVYDILGKQVVNTTVTNKRLDVSSLNAGVYIMRVAQDEASITKKIVIQ